MEGHCEDFNEETTHLLRLAFWWLSL
jgi:hypothetical protein